MEKKSEQSLTTLRKRAIALRQQRKELLNELRSVEVRLVKTKGENDHLAIQDIQKIINEL